MNVINYQADQEHNLASSLINELNTNGYVLLRNYPIDYDHPEETILNLSSRVGTPISHDKIGTLVWDVKQNIDSRSNIKTYSEHNHEALLHTDSQYSFYPEDYFSLLCLKKATCGGGLSYLLTLKDILEDLDALPNGEKIKDVLYTQEFPFVVPSVFSKQGETGYEFNFGPILRENEIRFRVDILEKALDLNPDYKTPDRMEAYQALKDIILNSPKTLSFHMENDEILFINNKTALHGRSAFQDSHRHLLRVRMNKFGHTAS